MSILNVPNAFVPPPVLHIDVYDHSFHQYEEFQHFSLFLVCLSLPQSVAPCLSHWATHFALWLIIGVHVAQCVCLENSLQSPSALMFSNFGPVLSTTLNFSSESTYWLWASIITGNSIMPAKNTLGGKLLDLVPIYDSAIYYLYIPNWWPDILFFKRNTCKLFLQAIFMRVIIINNFVYHTIFIKC